MSSSTRPSTTDYQHLTPRTPRSTRNTSFTAKQDQLATVQDADEIDYLQTSPLLQSARSPGFPPDARDGLPSINAHSKARRRLQLGALEAVRRWIVNAFERAPLAIGTVVALLLFALWVLSLKRPEVLQQVIGTSNSTNDASTGSNLASTHGIDYSNYTTFPLTSAQYEEQCWKVQSKMKGHGKFWDTMPGMDLDVPHEDTKGGKVCSSTVTYLLDGSTGLVFHLAIIAQLAAMAGERDRTFIIDDQNWNRGKWTDHFQDVRETQPGPEPGCLPPPPQELVACPRSAKHWVITPRTAKFHLGHEFDEEFQDPYKSDIFRFKPIYDQARESFDFTILPAPKVREHLDSLRATWGGEPYIGVHIRRGDRIADNQKWRRDYVPVAEYLNAVTKAWQELRSTDEGLAETPNVYVASDSRAAYEDFKAFSTAPDAVKGLFDAKTTTLQYMAQMSGYIQPLWEKRSRIEERKRWTTGMILDLAMISGLWLKDGEKAPLATVCTLTSNVCKVAAVGLGWERALVEGWWKDIDWAGIVYPRWEAFELV